MLTKPQGKRCCRQRSANSLQAFWTIVAGCSLLTYRLSLTGWLYCLCRGFLRFPPMTPMRNRFLIDLAVFISVGMFDASVTKNALFAR